MTDEELKQAIKELDDTKAQPKREWIDLTRAEINIIVDEHSDSGGIGANGLCDGESVADAVAAKLKDKNT